MEAEQGLPFASASPSVQKLQKKVPASSSISSSSDSETEEMETDESTMNLDGAIVNNQGSFNDDRENSNFNLMDNYVNNEEGGFLRDSWNCALNGELISDGKKKCFVGIFCCIRFT